MQKKSPKHFFWGVVLELNKTTYIKQLHTDGGSFAFFYSISIKPTKVSWVLGTQHVRLWKHIFNYIMAIDQNSVICISEDIKSSIWRSINFLNLNCSPQRSGWLWASCGRWTKPGSSAAERRRGGTEKHRRAGVPKSCCFAQLCGLDIFQNVPLDVRDLLQSRAGRALLRV